MAKMTQMTVTVLSGMATRVRDAIYESPFADLDGEDFSDPTSRKIVVSCSVSADRLCDYLRDEIGYEGSRFTGFLSVKPSSAEF